ncbi:MAG TPA: hypothetical protein PKC28_14825 [Bdellovibrionales bacterium]|nr:hypothetical protein [Bdellovibrionales bacterium]
MKYILFALMALPALAANERILNWQDTPGITETEALAQTRAAVAQELGVDEDGEICTVDEMRHFEREPDKTAWPVERGEIFSITAYAEGPYRGCSGTRTYDCRVTFQKPKGALAWRVEFTECELVSPEFED